MGSDTTLTPETLAELRRLTMVVGGSRVSVYDRERYDEAVNPAVVLALLDAAAELHQIRKRGAAGGTGLSRLLAVADPDDAELWELWKARGQLLDAAAELPLIRQQWRLVAESRRRLIERSVKILRHHQAERDKLAAENARLMADRDAALQVCADAGLTLGQMTLPLASVAQIARLEAENAGLVKANALLMKGMESQCELMDGLKQENRRLTEARTP